VILKPHQRPDWFTWHDPDMDWCRANAELPGLQFENLRGHFVANYHISHVPCMPDEVQIEHNVVEQARQQQVVLPFESSGLLRPYQFTDLQYLKARKGALLAYEMRLGKSPLACHLHNPNEGLLVVVGPLAAREAWQEWVEKTLNYPPFLLYGRKDAEPQPGYPAYFCHYDVLDAHTPFLTSQKIGTLVLDEMHMLQARGTQRLTAVNAVAFHSKKILGLTGTPCWNKPKSLWVLLHLLNPGAWGTQFEFRKRWAGAEPGAYGWTFEGATNTDELQARLRTIMVRRTWSEVMPELPATTRVIESVDISGAAYAAIEAATMKATLARGTANAVGYLATLRRKLAEVKIKPALEIARQAAADGHKVVLWVWHNEIGDKIEAVLRDSDAVPNVYRIRASQDGFQRECVKAEFTKHPGPAFLVAGIQVGGVALDFSASDYAIFVELDWTPANMQQATMRTFHKDRPHVLVFLHADDPVETKLIEALDVKNAFANALGLGFEDVARSVLT
jgi:SNF2 family DNA or RNA helicase